MNIEPLQFYKCLADDTRLKAMLLIQEEGELCVCELMEALSLSQPKVSRHLAQLRCCHLLNDRKEGQWVYYSLNPELPEWCKAVLASTAEANKAYLSEPIKNLCCMEDRPVSQLKTQCC